MTAGSEVQQLNRRIIAVHSARAICPRRHDLIPALTPCPECIADARAVLDKAQEAEISRPFGTPALFVDVEREEAIKMVLRGFDEGVFVRDTKRDHESGWAIRFLPFMQALERLAALPPSAEG